MSDLHSSFISKSVLRSHWDTDFRAWKGSDEERALTERLKLWSRRTDLKETSAEAAFIDVFFRDTWGYNQTGQSGAETEFNLYPKFPVPGAGLKGEQGAADLAAGFFVKKMQAIPQVLCEFKGTSGLDANQKRKSDTRSPVRQCLDYLSFSRRGMIGSEPVLPTWGIVTNMSEFRLYWYDRGHQQSVRFIIPKADDLLTNTALLADDEEARFELSFFENFSPGYFTDAWRQTLTRHPDPATALQRQETRKSVLGDAVEKLA